ncbi:MAG: hypothetical protein GYA34_16680 [Chloroflexi bacterium]|nr:hypothetical protein [Chloroflexota bacterium]
MIRRSTWLVLAIFVVLLAVVLLLPKIKGIGTEATPSITPALESPFTFSVSDVVEFDVLSSDGVSVKVKRGEDNKWKLVEPQEEISESNNVEGVVSGVININLLSKISPPPPADVSGIASPQYFVTMINASGKEEKFSIGNLTPTSSGYYIETSDKQVYVADKYKIEQVIDLVKNPPIKETPTPTPEISETPLASSTPKP